MREEVALQPADCTAQHCADEQCWREHPAGRAARKRKRSSNDFQAGKHAQHLPSELVVQCFVNELVPCAHHLRRTKVRDDSDQQAGDGGLKILRPVRQCF